VIPPARIVIDASVAMKWIIEEPGSAQATALLDRHLVAPDLLGIECANAIWKYAARKEISKAEALVKAEMLAAAEIEFVAMRSYIAAATSLAIELRHSAYDCIYLALAEDMSLPLVTADATFTRKVTLGAPRFRTLIFGLSEITTS
jgi:predicted nucleic acid-binding protein